jgi:hypothetical protein
VASDDKVVVSQAYVIFVAIICFILAGALLFSGVK